MPLHIQYTLYIIDQLTQLADPVYGAFKHHKLVVMLEMNNISKYPHGSNNVILQHYNLHSYFVNFTGTNYINYTKAIRHFYVNNLEEIVLLLRKKRKKINFFVTKAK